MDNFLIFYPEHSSLKLPKGSLNHRSPSIALFFSFTARFSHPKIVDNHNLQFMATSLSPQKTRSCSTAAIDWRVKPEQKKKCILEQLLEHVTTCNFHHTLGFGLDFAMECSHDGGEGDVAARSGGSEASLGDCCWASTADDGLSGGTKGKVGI
ncbi:hypothetical protein MRB53_032474 [Persea americana]|uniref:Uncharacterized protein n=2 Tax=Persea americana TaxID=3435 RepID=A0ACC2KRV6_PERAE|nr:hypothetical protein MRB53_032464 [Persea americana]KAJ8623944.1 hypothetical protein MRB53_032474 [Persea americana]